jgi:SAM-dependent methyltransferase
VDRYRDTPLCRDLCGRKPFGSRHWEYPWTVEKSGVAGKKGLRILDVAPDFTFPYADFLESKHTVTFIDLEKRQWSDAISWGAGVADLAERSDYRMMDVRHMSFGDDTFDIIFCISVLEHIVCPTQNPDDPGLSDLFSPEAARPALEEMRRCLKPGGKLLLTVDIYGGPKWKAHFDRWNIFSDLTAAGFETAGLGEFDRELAFRDSETFISLFHGPYITLGFCLTK